MATEALWISTLLNQALMAHRQTCISAKTKASRAAKWHLVHVWHFQCNICRYVQTQTGNKDFFLAVSFAHF